MLMQHPDERGFLLRDTSRARVYRLSSSRSLSVYTFRQAALEPDESTDSEKEKRASFCPIVRIHMCTREMDAREKCTGATTMHPLCGVSAP